MRHSRSRQPCLCSCPDCPEKASWPGANAKTCGTEGRTEALPSLGTWAKPKSYRFWRIDTQDGSVHRTASPSSQETDHVFICFRTWGLEGMVSSMKMNNLGNSRFTKGTSRNLGRSRSFAQNDANGSAWQNWEGIPLRKMMYVHMYDITCKRCIDLGRSDRLPGLVMTNIAIESGP